MTRISPLTVVRTGTFFGSIGPIPRGLFSWRLGLHDSTLLVDQPPLHRYTPIQQSQSLPNYGNRWIEPAQRRSQCRLPT